MFKIKNSKLYGSNYAFALPEGFYFIASLDVKSGDSRIVFVGADEHLIIMIDFVCNSLSAKKDTQDIIDANKNIVPMGDFISVKRGEGVGIGLYYKDEIINLEYYEERYDFKKNIHGETQFDLNISLRTGRGGSEMTIREALDSPAVKAFLESIEYF